MVTSLSLARLLHPFPKTQRAHVGPDLLDVRQALLLGAALPLVGSPQRILPVGGPDRILFFVVDDNLVDGGVFPFVFLHDVLPVSAKICRSLLHPESPRNLSTGTALAESASLEFLDCVGGQFRIDCIAKPDKIAYPTGHLQTR